jgi:hypothetical protein
VGHLRRLLQAVEPVYPTNYPDLADYAFALGGALHNLVLVSHGWWGKVGEGRRLCRRALTSLPGEIGAWKR